MESELELIKHQWNNSNSNLKPQPSLGFFGILKESFKTANRNRKLLFPVLLLVFLSFSQLNFAEVNYLLEPPVAEDFSLQLANHPNMALQDIGDNPNLAIYIRKLSLVTLSILTLDWIINLVFLIATVSSSSKAYTSKPLDPKETISNIRKSYKNVIKTSVCLVLITLGLVTLCLGIVSLILAAAGSISSSVAYIISGVVSLWIGGAMCFYYSALWMMSMVVSVLEEDVGGLAAIVRAKQVIKGKRVKASLMMVLVAVVYGLVHLAEDVLIPVYNLDKWSRLAVTIPFGNGMICLLKLFVFVVFTVFYHQGKECCEEKEGIKGIYVPIAALEV